MESSEAHDARLHAAIQPYAIPPWPYPGPALLRESSYDGERVDVHVLRDWCWLGTARDEGELAHLLETSPRSAFDIDVLRLLLRRHRAGKLAARPACSTKHGEDLRVMQESNRDLRAAGDLPKLTFPPEMISHGT